jgi:hypothetical protein
VVGDTNDFLSRLKMVLPTGWFADTTPVLDAVLTGFAGVWSQIFSLIGFVKAQSRIATAAGIFLDIAAVDYLGVALPRRSAESDSSYSLRIRLNLLMPKATRASVVQAIVNLTGRSPNIFEPLNPTDTGGYNSLMGYNSVGGYGSFNLPYQFFVTAYRPNDMPINNTGAYCIGPGGYGAAPMSFSSVQEFTGTVTDADIYAAISSVLPVSTIAWTNISN